MERKRRVEREKVKEGLRVWLERKAGEIGRRRKKDGVGVGILVWRFSKRVKITDVSERERARARAGSWESAEKGRVMGLKRFWEGLGGGSGTARVGA